MGHCEKKKDEEGFEVGDGHCSRVSSQETKLGWSLIYVRKDCDLVDGGILFIYMYWVAVVIGSLCLDQYD